MTGSHCLLWGTFTFILSWGVGGESVLNTQSRDPGYKRRVRDDLVQCSFSTFGGGMVRKECLKPAEIEQMHSYTDKGVIY